MKYDLLHYTVTLGDTLSAGETEYLYINATSSGHRRWAPQLYGAHKNMRGTIENIAVWLDNATLTSLAGMEVAFFSDSNVNCTTLADDPYIDHESFAKGGYLVSNATNSKPGRVSTTAQVPYFNSTGDWKIHIGIKNLMSSTAIPQDDIRVDLTFRPDPGGA